MKWRQVCGRSSSQCLLAARLFCLAAAVTACGGKSTEPQPPAGLTGNFAITGSTGFWLGVTLRESGGIVTGTGWSGNLNRLRQGMTITGTYQPPGVQLDLVPRKGGPTGHFNGAFDRDTLRGIYELDPFSKPYIELTRIDTVPTGEYVLHLTGALSGDFVGDPTFTTISAANAFALELESAGPPQYRVVFFWESANRPPARVYSLSFGPGAAPLAGVYRYDAPVFVQLLPLAGTLTLEVSTRWALIGRFDLTVTDPTTGGTVTARGSFSAGCTGTAC